MAEKMDVKECADVIVAGVAYANLGLEVAEDKKVDWQDALRVGAKVPELFIKTQAAIVGGDKIPAELEDFSPEEGVQLVSLVASDLKVGEGKAKKIVLASLKALAANGLLVKAIIEPEQQEAAPVAPSA